MTSRKAKSNHVFLRIPIGFAQLSDALAESTEELSFSDHAKFLSDYWRKHHEQISLAKNAELSRIQANVECLDVDAFRRTEVLDALSVFSSGWPWKPVNEAAQRDFQRESNSKYCFRSDRAPFFDLLPMACGEPKGDHVLLSVPSRFTQRSHPFAESSEEFGSVEHV